MQPLTKDQALRTDQEQPAKKLAPNAATTRTETETILESWKKHQDIKFNQINDSIKYFEEAVDDLDGSVGAMNNQRWIFYVLGLATGLLLSVMVLVFG